jgi:fatty acid desaturase
MERNLTKHAFDRSILADAEALCELDNWHALIALACDFGVIVLSIFATLKIGWACYPLALLLIGSRQRALATIVHEASHGTLARNKKLERVLATWFSGYLIFSTLNAYRRSHVTGHHGRFGDPEGDADYRYMLDKGVYVIKDRAAHAWEFLLKPCLLGHVPSYLGYLVKQRAFGEKKSRTDRIENLKLCVYWIAILAVTAYYGQLLHLLLFWIVPFLTSFQVIGWFIELAEHAPLMQNGRDIHMTRNRNSHWLEGLLTGMHSESYHLAHHLRPRVPFWRMGELHQVLMRDATYRQWDSECGGIFFSRNGAPSVVPLLLQRAE